MSMKIIKETRYNVGIVESYKKTKEGHNIDHPVLGTFSVKGMTVENMVSQNRTRYSEAVWSQPTSFGRGGKFIDENGKLKPASLFGSVDHPTDDRAELLLTEAAIAWYDVKRNPDGSWDGSADILNNPQGKIAQTFLEYAKMRGGSSLLGVSSRALGESVTEETADGYVEAIVPESFELMSFDFVYNPSFQTAVARLNESAKSGKKLKPLTESIKALAEEDEENAKYYEEFAENLEEEANSVDKMIESSVVSKAKEEYIEKLRDSENELQNELYKIRKMDDEEFASAYKTNKKGARERALQKIKDALFEVQAELEDFDQKPKEVKESKEPKTEEPKAETLLEKFNTIAEAEGNEGNKKYWTVRGLPHLLRWGILSVKDVIGEMTEQLKSIDTKAKYDKYKEADRKIQLKYAVENLSEENFNEMLDKWVKRAAELIGIPDPSVIYHVSPQDIFNLIRSKDSEVGSWMVNNQEDLKTTLGESTMAKKLSADRKFYRMNLSTERAKEMIKLLKDQNMYYEVSQYGDKVRFDVLCNVAERIEINSKLRDLTENKLLRIVHGRTIVESDILDDFMDEEKERELGLSDDEEDNEDDENLDDDEDNEDDEEDNDEDDEDELDLDDDEDEDLDLEAKVDKLTQMVEDLVEFLMPIEESEVEEDELDIELDEEDNEDEEDDLDDDDFALEDIDMNEDDLDELSEEELEYLAGLPDKKS